MNIDLTNASDTRAYMEQSKNESDWNKRCDEVKAANYGGYPVWWFDTIILSGIAGETSKRWHN